MSEKITARVTEEEKKMAEELANYLHRHGKLEEPTISGAVRASLHYMVGDILKAIEAERYAR